MTIDYLGKPAQAEIILYLPTQPIMPDDGKVDIPSLIELNGNHWRKIFSIYAKLCVQRGSWQEYRDQQLLTSRQAISFKDQLYDKNAIHIIAGKASWHRLDLNPETFKTLDNKGLSHSTNSEKGTLLLTPYPDYRQFPNILVEQIRQHLYS